VANGPGEVSADDVRRALVKSFFDAFCARDWEAMASLFGDDAQLGMSGRSPFAGEHRGPKAVTSVFRGIVERSGGTFGPVREDTWDICTSDDHVVLLEWFTARRNERELRAYLYFVCAVEKGRIARMFVHSSEQYEFDDFWS
jgi:ketosteroid isomerase-like protein